MYGRKVLYNSAGDLVLYGGYIYKAVTFNTGKSPANYTSDWNLLLKDIILEVTGIMKVQKIVEKLLTRQVTLSG